MKEVQKTFWKTISKYSIEIPNIQRDYTYGRPSAESIREKLILAIHSACISDKNLHLDFVYGKLNGVENHLQFDRNKETINTLMSSLKNYAENLHIDLDFSTETRVKESAEIITFIPLDGQQRLTTLFLVHWFLAKKNNNQPALSTLSRFNYATRNSSRDFLKMLIGIDSKLIINNSKQLSEIIKTHESFFSFWTNDPTVKSMLIVLDIIDGKFQKSEYHLAWTNLTDKKKVTFDFFDLEDFEQTDELYVKMNARGKKLTHFENFKAWLIKTHGDIIKTDNWRKKLDLDWNDLFWKAKSTEIDIAYLKYFKRMFLGDFILHNDLEETKIEFIEILRLNDSENPIYIFEQDKTFGIKINEYIQLLEICRVSLIDSEFNKEFYRGTLKDLIFNDPVQSNWSNETFYFAITRYLIFNKGDDTYLHQWIRVVSNLIYNSVIESPKLFKEACQSILDLLEITRSQSIYNVVKKLNVDTVSFFLPKQIEEEVNKANYIISEPDKEWESLFVSLETEKYFRGQIGFIFDLCDDKTFQTFESVGGKISALYSEKIMNDDSYLLFRALLTQGDCFFKSGNTLTYPSNIRGTLRERNKNWRRFIDQFPQVIKSLIHLDTFETEDIESFLKDLTTIPTIIDDFRICIIKSDELLKYPEQNHIKKYDNAHYLLRTSRIFGYYVELFTYNWFLKNRSKDIEYEYGIKEENLNNTGLRIKGDKLIFFAKKSGCFKVNHHQDLEFKSVDEALLFIDNF